MTPRDAAAEDRIANRRPFALVAVCFLISGFAALLYETVWLRQFAILLGTSEQALAVVLAAYMGGLAIGSLVASRIVDSIRRPLLTYGLLECGIAVSALLVPVGLAAATQLQVAVLGGASEPPPAGSLLQVTFCLLTAFGLILIPTGLMGATLPLLARHMVARDEDIGPQIGLLYAINTAGAVLGTICAAFICLPAFGLGRTTWIGAAANGVVFLLVIKLVREQTEPTSATVGLQDESSRSKLDEPEAHAGEGRERKKRGKKGRAKGRSAAVSDAAVSDAAVIPSDPPYRWILLFAAISGAVSFCYEIVFTRMLGHMLGGSVFAFATMLSGFLLGIAIGGAIASRFATSRPVAAIGFVYAQCGAAICTLVAFHTVNRMMAWDWEGWGGASATSVQVLASILVLLPTATCVGATFPLAIRIYAKDETVAASGSARVYGWNVIGGIVGALATGALILPLLQYHGATSLAVLCNITIAIAVVLVLRAGRVHLAFPVLAIAVFGFAFPTAPENVLRISALSGMPTEGEILYNHVGKSATVTVFYDDGKIRFQTNGLPESTVLPLGSGDIYRSNATWLSALPPLVRPGCKSMLIIGLGGGVAAEFVPPSVERIDVLELEPAVVEANREVAHYRDRNPLADPRVHVILNDGRNALALTDKKYDAIVSQPSHPWTAGASHLYTREFNAVIRERLNPGGVFLQWMNTQFVDEELVRSMGATLIDVFPHARLYQPFGGTFMFVASDAPIAPESVVEMDDRGVPVCKMANVDRSYYRRLGVVTPTHLFSMLSLDHDGLVALCSGAEMISDERNLLAMRAPRLLATEHDADRIREYVDDFSPVIQRPESVRQLCPTFDARVFGIQKLERSQVAWVRDQLLSRIDSAEDRAVVEAGVIRATKPPDAWFDFLLENARRYPAEPDLAFQLLSNRAVGKRIDFSDEEEVVMRATLSAVQRDVVDLLEQMAANELDGARTKDAELAAIPVDDVAFEWGVRLRLPWRLETVGDDRIRNGLDAVGIIDDSAPFSNSSGLVWFRAAAAINGRQPFVALATINQQCDTIALALDDPELQVDAGSISNLLRCRNLLSNPALFVETGPQYLKVLRKVESLLQATNNQ